MSKSKRALITGVSGQDGAYLSKLLLNNGYEVYGTSRDMELQSFSGLHKLGIDKKVNILSMALNDFGSVHQGIKEVQPDEIYNLGGQSSVALSFSQPSATFESIINGTLNCLEAIRMVDKDIKFYNAGSSECFGDTQGEAANENTSFHPQSPYAVAKSASHWMVRNYRESYGIFASSGILFNHESPLRPERFVTQKIVSSAIAILEGRMDYLELGNIDIQRDWGWAPEYVQAMHLILQQDKPDDFVIATGQTHSLKDFVRITFDYLGLDWEKYVKISQKFSRPSDIRSSFGNPAKAKKTLNWESSFNLEDIISEMIEEKKRDLHKQYETNH